MCSGNPHFTKKNSPPSLRLLDHSFVASLDKGNGSPFHGDPWSVTFWLGPSCAEACLWGEIKLSGTHVHGTLFTDVSVKESFRKMFAQRSDMTRCILRPRFVVPYCLCEPKDFIEIHNLIQQFLGWG